MKYLEKLSHNQAFICLKEHWLWTYEKDYIDEHTLVPDMMNHSRCHDVNDPKTRGRKRKNKSHRN